MKCSPVSPTSVPLTGTPSKSETCLLCGIETAGGKGCVKCGWWTT